MLFVFQGFFSSATEAELYKSQIKRLGANKYYWLVYGKRVGTVEDVTMPICSGPTGGTTGTVSIKTQSPNATLVSHTCNNFNLTQTNCCSATFHINVEAETEYITELNIPVTYPEYSKTEVYGIMYRGIDTTVSPICPMEKTGSIININTGTVGETIPVVGAPFSLVYNSGYSADYWTTFPLVKNAYFGPQMWMPSIQAYYNTFTERLYKGSGASVYAKHRILSTGELLVIDSDGGDAFIFSSNGKHLQTKSTLTGYVKYNFNYDPTTSKLISIVDSYGNQTNFTYSSGNLSSITAPFGQITSITTNGSGLIASATNPNSEVHSMTYYSGTELLNTMTFPSGKASTFLYESDGKLKKDSSSAGNFSEIFRTQNSNGDTVTQASSLGRLTSFQTNKVAVNSSISTEVNSFGGSYISSESSSTFSRTTPYESTSKSIVDDERFGDLYKRQSGLTLMIGGTSRSTTYSQVVNPPVLTDPFVFSSITKTSTTNGNSWTDIYDASTKARVVTSPQGQTNTIVIDSYERPVSTTLGSDTATTFTYDLNGRISSSIQGSKNQMSYTYNTAGLLASITNARSEVIGYAYDLAGRLAQVTHPDARVSAYTYDAAGNLTSVTPPSKPAHGFWYNLFDEVSQYLPPSLVGLTTKDTIYTYNNDKQLTQITRPDGIVVDLNYNATTGLLNTMGTSAGVYSYTYKTNSDLWDVVSSPDDYNNTFSWQGKEMKTDAQRQTSANLLFGKTTIGFDANHRPNSRTIQGRSNGTTYTRNTTYNGDGMPTQIGDMNLAYSYPSGRLSTTSLDKISDFRTYDVYGYLASYTATYTPTSGSPVVLYSYSLTRDIGSRISGKTETIQGVTDTYSYSFDTAGRLTQVLKNGSAYSSYVYDTNGNRSSGTTAGVAFTATFDNQDRILTYNSRTYTHGANGELTQVQVTPTTQNLYTYDVFGKLKQTTLTSGVVLSYSYDGLGRRIRKMEGSTFKYQYIYENGERIAAHVNNSGVIQKEYVYGEHINSADYMIVGAIKYRIIKDHLGSPRLVVNTTDGTVSQRMDYNDLGKVTSDSNQGFQHFGFAGGIYDGQSKLVKFGARDYDAETGRWTSKDPIRFDGGDTNLYGYVLQDPINFVDPSGLISEADKARGAKFAGVGATAGLVLGICTSAGIATAGYAAVGTVVGYGLGVAPGAWKDFTDILNGTPAPGNIFK